MKDAFTEISDAIGRLRAMFKVHGFEAPKAIELATHEDCDRLSSILPPAHMPFMPALHDDGPVMVTSIMGIEIIAPARFRACARGGFDIE